MCSLSSDLSSVYIEATLRVNLQELLTKYKFTQPCRLLQTKRPKNIHCPSHFLNNPMRSLPTVISASGNSDISIFSFLDDIVIIWEIALIFTIAFLDVRKKRVGSSWFSRLSREQSNGNFRLAEQYMKVWLLFELKNKISSAVTDIRESFQDIRNRSLYCWWKEFEKDRISLMIVLLEVCKSLSNFFIASARDCSVTGFII